MEIVQPSGSFEPGFGEPAPPIHSFQLNEDNTHFCSNGFLNPVNQTLSIGSNTCCSCAITVGFANTASGTYSVALGYDNTASGYTSTSIGSNNQATGCFSTASGFYNTASGCNSSSYGTFINNSCANSVELGPNNTSKVTIRSGPLVGINTENPQGAIHAIETTGITIDPPSSVTSFLTLDTSVDSPAIGSAVQLNGPLPTGAPTLTLNYIDNVIDGGFSTSANYGTSGPTDFIAQGQTITGWITAYRNIGLLVTNPITFPWSYTDTMNDGSQFTINLGTWATNNGYYDGFIVLYNDPAVGVDYWQDVGNVTSTTIDAFTTQDAYTNSAYDASTGATWNGYTLGYNVINGTQYAADAVNGNTVDGAVAGAYLIINATFSSPAPDAGQYYETNSGQYFDQTLVGSSFDDYGQAGAGAPSAFSSIAFPYFNTSMADPNTLADPTFGAGSGNYIANGYNWYYEVWEYRNYPGSSLHYFVSSPQTSNQIADDGMGENITVQGSFTPGDGDGYVIKIFNDVQGLLGIIDIGGATSFDTESLDTSIVTTPTLSSFTGMTFSWEAHGKIIVPSDKYSLTHKDYTKTSDNPTTGFIWVHTLGTFGNATNLKILESSIYRATGNFYDSTIATTIYEFNGGLGNATVTPATLGYVSSGQTVTYDVYSTANENGTNIFSSTSTNRSQTFPNDGLTRYVTLTIANSISGAIFRVHKVGVGFEDTPGIFSTNVTYQDTVAVPWNGASDLDPKSYIYAVEILEKSVSAISDPPFLILRNTNNVSTNTGIAFQHGSSTFPTNDALVQIQSTGNLKSYTSTGIYEWHNATNGTLMNRMGPTQFLLNSPNSSYEIIVNSNTSGNPIIYSSAGSGTRFFGVNTGSTTPITGVIFSVDDRNTTNNINAYLTGNGSGNYITAEGKITNHGFYVDNFGRVSAGTNQQSTAGLAVGNQSSTTAGMRLIPGTLVSSTVSGNIENDASNLWYTPSTLTRKQILVTGTGSQLTNNFIPVANGSGQLIDSHWQDSGTLLIASLQIEAKNGISLDSNQNISMGSGSIIQNGVRFSYVAKTANYTLTGNDHTVNTTSGTFNYTVPTAVSINGRENIIINSGTGVSTLLTTSGQTINGLASGAITLSQRQGLMIISDGANYISPGVLAGSIVGTLTGSQITGSALTKTDDTNVTLTLGGSPTTALLNAASLTLGWTGTLAVSRGGTGASSLLGAGIPTTTNVQLTNQGADIAAANLATVAGLYLVSYSLQDTTADLTAGAAILTISYTDGAGAGTATATQVLTGLGRQSGSVYVQLASGNLTYAVSHTGLFGTAKYALYITTERYI